MNETLQYYNEKAEEYFGSTIDADMSICRNKFVCLIPEHGNILDIGCGSGRDSRVFMDNGYTVEAMDGSEKMCRLASAYLGQKVKNITFEDIAYTQEFDGIWACASLLHVSKNELPGIMTKLYRALKDSGVLYVSFKYGDGERTEKSRSFSDFTEQGAIELMENAGFSVLECFVTQDVRAERQEERWVNVFGRVMRMV